MSNFEGSTPVPFTRWLGRVDQSDPTNLPMGCAAMTMNCRFTLTEVETRFGIQTAIQGRNPQPITGLLGTAYTPESATQVYFQRIILFDALGTLMVEQPQGTGNTTGVLNPYSITLPAKSHMIGTQVANRAWMAFSNLLTPTSYPCVYDLATDTAFPYGMKPVGFAWQPGLPVLEGECCVPSTIEDTVYVATGNGHLYVALNSGTTGQTQPDFPTGDHSTVVDNPGAQQITWQEATPVMANRIAAPNAPTMTRVASVGSWPAGDDVYAMITFVNSIGETIPSLPSVIVDTNLDDDIHVSIPLLNTLPFWVQNLPSAYIPTGAQIYIASNATGSGVPPLSQFNQVAGGPFNLGTTQGITSQPSGAQPPTINTARVTGGQLPIPVVAPTIVRSSGTGGFAAGRDIYVIQTYLNNNGETTPGPASSIIDSQLDDAVTVTIAGLTGYEVTAVRIYECDVPTGSTFGGSDFPPFNEFALVGTFGIGTTQTISNSATGAAPPTTNTTGTAGNIAQDTLQGGPNSTQGYRYMGIMFEDQFDTISGFTQGSVVQYDVDESGYELAVFNIPVGPSYIKNVIMAFTIADGSSAGPFAYNPYQTTVAGAVMTSTMVTNGVTSATVNFYDSYLTSLIAEAATNLTDRLRVIWPQQCVDIFYSPSTNRIFQTGVPGFYSGHWASLAGDFESYYGDTGNVTVGDDDGERAWCVREYRGVVYSLRERSGFELNPTTADPATWTPTRRWSLVGPCGPRAVDTCGQFMIFVHSSGVYKFEDAYPELVSKELPRWWNTINWQAAQYIWVAIDVEQHEVHMGFPVGGSTIPNVELVLNYEEGWNNPLLFSRYSGKEITIEQCRKYSVNNIAAYLGARLYRTIPSGVGGVPVPVEGPVGTEEQVSRQLISQFLFASSGPDGTVQAITPGVYNDNGAGIDCQYEGIAQGQMMSLAKLSGINLNARGYGDLYTSFIAGARQVTDWTPPGNPVPEWFVPLRPFGLELNPTKGLTRMTPSRLNERWRPRFTNGAVADSWFSLKEATVFVNPMFKARNVAESPQTQSS